MLSFWGFPFISCFLYAVLYLYFPLTRNCSELLFATLHDFTSSILLPDLLSICVRAIWLLVLPSGDFQVCLWISLCGYLVEYTIFFTAARFSSLCPLSLVFTCRLSSYQSLIISSLPILEFKYPINILISLYTICHMLFLFSDKRLPFLFHPFCL